MALDDWLLENEDIRFSVYDSYSREEIAVTNRRLIFYRSGLARETLESYNLNHIAGYRIETVRRIALAVVGAIITLISVIILYQIFTFTIRVQPEILALIPFSTLMIGIGLLAAGLLSQQILELTIAGRKITKSLKLSRKQLTELAKALQL